MKTTVEKKWLAISLSFTDGKLLIEMNSSEKCNALTQLTWGYSVGQRLVNMSEILM